MNTKVVISLAAWTTNTILTPDMPTDGIEFLIHRLTWLGWLNARMVGEMG